MILKGSNTTATLSLSHTHTHTHIYTHTHTHSLTHTHTQSLACRLYLKMLDIKQTASLIFSELTDELRNKTGSTEAAADWDERVNVWLSDCHNLCQHHTVTRSPTTMNAPRTNSTNTTLKTKSSIVFFHLLSNLQISQSSDSQKPKQQTGQTPAQSATNSNQWRPTRWRGEEKKKRRREEEKKKRRRRREEGVFNKRPSEQTEEGKTWRQTEGESREEEEESKVIIFRQIIYLAK